MSSAYLVLQGRSMQQDQVLKEVFGYDAFRTGQADAVSALVSGQDVLCILPTGGGKSLCYQVPAIVRHGQGLGATLVISPLIALMDDQVHQLRAKGVAAAALHSHQDADEQRDILARLRRGELSLLYASPERALSSGFRRQLASSKICALAIDEAHCISQWGHDFRPEYNQLAALRIFLDIPLIALTATATPRIEKEILAKLALRDPLIVRSSFVRPNLAFALHAMSSDQRRMRKACEILETRGLRGRTNQGRAIIYCATRKKVEQVAKALRALNYAVGYYHAGRTELARKRAQISFERARTRVLVATNAFGMGIDSPDIRLVLHYQCPGSVEAYYQEAGRAGRDGMPSACVLFHGKGDLMLQRRMLTGSSAAKGADSLLRIYPFFQRNSKTSSLLRSLKCTTLLAKPRSLKHCAAAGQRTSNATSCLNSKSMENSNSTKSAVLLPVSKLCLKMVVLCVKE